MVKLEKKKIKLHYPIKEIRPRHRSSEEVVNIQKKNDQSQEWVVASTSLKDNFLLSRILRMSPVRVNLSVMYIIMWCMCPYVHMHISYFLLKAVSCKHIHAVHSLKKKSNLKDAVNSFDEVKNDSTRLIKKKTTTTTKTT